MITHAFVPPPGLGDFCQHQHTWDGGVFVCSHKRADHEGESPLGDGPVRSTVERQQEHIKELEAEVNIRDARVRFQIRRRELEVAEMADALEAARYDRDLLRERLLHLDNLAREMLRRLRALDNR